MRVAFERCPNPKLSECKQGVSDIADVLGILDGDYCDRLSADPKALARELAAVTLEAPDAD